MVILLPVCQDHLAVFHDGRSFSLPIAFPATDETFAHAAQRLVVTLGNFKGSTLSCTGTISTVELCRADIPVVHGLPALSLPGMQWQAAARVHMREACHRAHFAALCLFGVLPPCDCVVNVASLAALAVSTPETSLLPDLLSSQQQDPFLQQVAEGVDSIDQGVWLDFLRNEQGLLCYSSDGDATSRICVPKVSRDAILHAAHGGALVGHPGVTRTPANVAHFFWWPNLFRDVTHFVCSCRTCATAKGSSGLQLGVDSFTSVPVQLFTHWSMDLIGPLPK